MNPQISLAVVSVAAMLVFCTQVLAEPLRIGVLAYRGTNHALARWRATAAYLDHAMPEHHFEIVALDLENMARRVEDGSLDFVLTNPGHYVTLEARFGVSRIATLKNLREGGAYTQFGAVILVRADRDELRTLRDLRGRTFSAVGRNAFGGFQMAWREMKAAGIDPFDDLSVRFTGFPQDAIVYAVRDGLSDAGTVRTDVMERMVGEGRIDPSNYRILSPRTTPGFPFRHSTRLYPEWPFAKLRNTPEPLAHQVAVALLTLDSSSPAAVDGRYAGWTIPLDYGAVHQLLSELGLAPYASDRSVSVHEVIAQYWKTLTAVAAVLLVLSALLGYALRLNRRIRISEQALSEHSDQLEARVRERTVALEAANRALEEDIEARVAVETTLRRSESTLRRLHRITTMADVGFMVRVASVLELGCAHLEREHGLLLRAEGTGWAVLSQHGEAWPERPSGMHGPVPGLPAPGELADGADPSRILHANGSFGSVITVNGQLYGCLLFATASDKPPVHASVDDDIVLLMARWLGSELELEAAQVQTRQRQDELAHVARQGTLSELATGLAHELNQPLTAILNYTRGSMRRLAARELDDPGIAESMRQVEREAERAAEVIRGLRDFLRKSEPQRTKVDVNEAIHEVLRMVRPEAAQICGQIELALSPSLSPVFADRVQLEQVILNLLRNALDSLREVDEDRRRLVLATREVAGEVHIEVHDTGAGLSGSSPEDLFDPFYTTKPDGMGMGLSISRTIARAHGGELHASNAEGDGATFRFSLPGCSEEGPHVH